MRCIQNVPLTTKRQPDDASAISKAYSKHWHYIINHKDLGDAFDFFASDPQPPLDVDVLNVRLLSGVDNGVANPTLDCRSGFFNPRCVSEVGPDVEIGTGVAAAFFDEVLSR